MTILSFLQQPLSIHVPSPFQAVTAAVVRLLHWQDVHRQRNHLSQLDDRMLEDIGLTRADVDYEISKPVWRL
jgi:uncharacterized protein YjiS (DUF1127 family)